MSLAPGTRLGPYQVVSTLGAGGMGEVYRARDSKLNRDVAIKVLLPSVANDPDRLARFSREAQVLASLNHPNIAAIYGLEEAPAADGRADARPHFALVMELVEGPTLADRIAAGAIPIDEALSIAKQMAEALEAAHEQGIIHRDLKPANVKVRPDGTVKVLDFGLAKALAPAGASATAEHSPTISMHATQPGIILGTAAYMSPEQAAGKPVDKRSDLWAFGVVLVEMLTGKPVFTGETVSHVLAAVLRAEPDWTRLPADTPASIRRLLRRCLEKDPKKRLSAMADARLELGERDDVVVAAAPPSPKWRIAVALVVGIALGAGLLPLALPLLRPTPVHQMSRVSMMAPKGVRLKPDPAESAISPDGRLIVFTAVDAGKGTQLWIRPLEALEAHPLAGAEHGILPFWSPDSRYVAFFADGKLKKVPASGGTVEVICDAPFARGGSWGTADVIVFAPTASGPLMRVSTGGGEPKPVTALDAALGETGHRFPSFLPDGRHFLFAALPQKGRNFPLYVASLDGGAPQLVTSAQSSAVYSPPGYLLFASKDVLMAQPFDLGRLQVTGEPVAVSAAPDFQEFLASRIASVSDLGALAFLGDRPADTKLQWFDRMGRQAGTLEVPEGRYWEMEFSPDGRRVVVRRDVTVHESDLWIVDVDRAAVSRFTSAPGQDLQPVWSPDGRRVIFSSHRNGPRDFFIKPVNGAAPEESLYASKDDFKDPTSWSPDGKSLVFNQIDPQSNLDLWILPLDGDRKPTLYLRTPFSELFGAISPDGRWLAYSSDESGRFEIYVDSFPTPRNKYKVTDGGGDRAVWRQDGRELAVVIGQYGDMRSVLLADVQSGAEFRASAPRQLLSLPAGTTGFAPTPDFQRFLVSIPVAETRTSSITLMLDWLSAVGKK